MSVWIAIAVAGLVTVTGFFVAATQFLKSIREAVSEAKALGTELKGARNVIERWKQLRSDRENFCSYLYLRIKQINDDEKWHRGRYTELEANVEATGHRRKWHVSSSSHGLRREKSLSVALRRSDEPLIVLEGEPGCGKSIALRNLAMEVLDGAKRSKRAQATIPLYINLKAFRPSGQVDAECVRNFVLSFLTQDCHDDDVIFLNEQFDRGLENGTWLFLFDSFDEIPSVVSGKNYERVAELYSDAIAAFLTRPSRAACRGVVASRYFRGPQQTLWTRFTILPLNSEQQLDLLGRLRLPKVRIQDVMDELQSPTSVIADLANIPLFLSLLAESFKRNTSATMPRTAYELFERHVDTQINSLVGADYIKKKRVTPDAVVKGARALAIAISTDPTLRGLSPDRDRLAKACQTQSLLSAETASIVIDVLEFVKLMRRDPLAATTSEPRPTTFVHRRFQEYFVSCYLFDEPGLIPASELATSSEWRESAVTALQIHGPASELSASIMLAADSALAECALQVPDYRQSNIDEERTALRRANRFKDFTWPESSRHLLGLLDEGISRVGTHALPPSTSDSADQLLLAASINGSLSDHRWAIELLGPSSPHVREVLLANAFRDGSLRLRNAAFAMVSRQRPLSKVLEQLTRQMLFRIMASGQLRQQKFALDAQLRRLSPPAFWHRIWVLVVQLTRVRLISWVLLASLIIWVLELERSVSVSQVVFVLLAGALLSLSYFLGAPIAANVDLSGTGGHGGSWTSSTEFRIPWWRRSTFVLCAIGVTSLVSFFYLSGRLASALSDQQKPPFWASWVAFGVVTYVASWPIGATMSLLTGRWTRISQWPLLPLVWGGVCAKRISITIRSNVAVLFVILGGIAFYAAIVPLTFSSSSPAVVKIPLWIAIGLFVGFRMLAMLGTAWAGVVTMFSERSTYSAFRDGLPVTRVVSGDFLRRWLPAFKTEPYLYKAIYSSAASGDAVDSSKTHDFVRDLLAIIELAHDGAARNSDVAGTPIFCESRRKFVLIGRRISGNQYFRIPESVPGDTCLWVQSNWSGKPKPMDIFSQRCIDELSRMLDMGTAESA